MTTDDPVTIAERYSTAAGASTLAPTGAAIDILIAAAKAVTKPNTSSINWNWVYALQVQRMVVTGQLGEAFAVVEHYDSMLNGHLSRKGRRPMPKPARRALVVSVLHWKMHMRCEFCGGAGQAAADGDDGRGKRLFTCSACHGAGVKPLSRAVPHEHARTAHWLDDMMNQHAREAFKQMRVLLNGPAP